ncbi:MAG: hypothetical protein WC758_07715 [Candidatus Woesearchaeota archaeon]|jgi:hypothetical protein
MKLKKWNMNKYCINCREIVTIKIDGLNGYCPYCEEILYTIDNKKKGLKDE